MNSKNIEQGFLVLGTATKNEHPDFSNTKQHTYAISDSVALRIYSDTKPQNMKTSNLQKGVILLYNGAEVIGEGTGFGVPIAKYSGETVFSGSSFLQVHRQENSVVIHKDFSMDLVTRDKFRNLKLENMQIRTIIDYVSLLYQKHKRLAQFILLAKEFLFKVGVTSVFIRTVPKGRVFVTYTVDRNRIHVKLSFSQLDRNNLQNVFVLNEQGAHFFRKYSDSEGLKLKDEEIGAWNDVRAQSAKITCTQGKIGFNLKTVEGTILRRGRELMKGSLDWTGLDYELNPKHDSFEYEIEILG
jgi:hypothetical protein